MIDSTIFNPETWRRYEREYRAIGLYNRAVAMQRFADLLEERGKDPSLDVEWLDRGVFDTHGKPFGFDPLPWEVDPEALLAWRARMLAEQSRLTRQAEFEK